MITERKAAETQCRSWNKRNHQSERVLQWYGWKITTLIRIPNLWTGCHWI